MFVSFLTLLPSIQIHISDKLLKYRNTLILLKVKTPMPASGQAYEIYPTLVCADFSAKKN